MSLIIMTFNGEVLEESNPPEKKVDKNHEPEEIPQLDMPELQIIETEITPKAEPENPTPWDQTTEQFISEQRQKNSNNQKPD